MIHEQVREDNRLRNVAETHRTAINCMETAGPVAQGLPSTGGTWGAVHRRRLAGPPSSAGDGTRPFRKRRPLSAAGTSVAPVELAVSLGHHPGRADQQVGQVGQEAGLAALELVADELRDPRHHEHAHRQPEQVVQADLGLQQAAQAAEHEELDEHADAQRARQLVVEAPGAEHRERRPDAVLEPGNQWRQAPQQGHYRPEDGRHRHHMDALVDHIAVVVGVAGEVAVDRPRKLGGGLHAALLPRTTVVPAAGRQSRA
ncbi:hypothetical protein G6F57_011369 [Rhizopus arrhizus]|nr:hypothetical protein G6F57_011369 [Rhizopus arrhizus]